MTAGLLREKSMSSLRDCIFGLAVGDALGVPYEFLKRDSFLCTDMIGYGSHDRPAGTFSDDTAMTLATCDSIRATGRINVTDLRKRFEQWAYLGFYTPDRAAFGIGQTTLRALVNRAGQSSERDNGNGSLMRIAPLAYTQATNEQIRNVSAITHAHEISMQACVDFVKILRIVVCGEEPDLSEWLGKPREQIGSTGYVVHTLEASLWCFANTTSYEECVLAAVNLGADADTTAAVAGALAGARYGVESIPTKWMETLRGKDLIETALF